MRPNLFYPLTFGAAFLLLIFSLFYFLRTYDSEVMVEQGIVVAKGYQPEFHANASGVGITSGGDVAFVGGSVHHPDKFNVAFKCEHNVVFTVNNSLAFADLNEGDRVLIYYKEERYKHNDELAGFEFVKAIINE